jgi:hypothetical protein
LTAKRSSKSAVIRLVGRRKQNASFLGSEKWNQILLKIFAGPGRAVTHIRTLADAISTKFKRGQGLAELRSRKVRP